MPKVLPQCQLKHVPINLKIPDILFLSPTLPQVTFPHLPDIIFNKTLIEMFNTDSTNYGESFAEFVSSVCHLYASQIV